jgi:hypothetical protein
MIEGTIPGWTSHKFVTGAIRIRPGSTIQVYDYNSLDALALKIEPVFIRRKGVEVKPFESCTGCGARKSEVRNGRLICTYCKGETNGKL